MLWREGLFRNGPVFVQMIPEPGAAEVLVLKLLVFCFPNPSWGFCQVHRSGEGKSGFVGGHSANCASSSFMAVTISAAIPSLRPGHISSFSIRRTCLSERRMIRPNSLWERPRRTRMALKSAGNTGACQGVFSELGQRLTMRVPEYLTATDYIGVSYQAVAV